MLAVETPKANPENLCAIIRDAYNAKVVLPEFQRSFVWTREDIEELLVSILQGYFIGTFLMLDTPVEKPMFPFRSVEGLEKINPAATSMRHATVRLALDGQQRITSLFYALFEPDLPLRNTKNPYRFYFRIDLALENEPGDAVTGISLADRSRMAEIQKLVKEHKAIPFSLLRDSSQFYKWFYQEQKFLQTDKQKAVVEQLYHRFEKFMVPVVALSPEAGRDNIVNIFERINRTGVSLSLFDLAVARLYLKQVQLRKLWEKFAEEDKNRAEVVKPEFLLKVIALLNGKETKKSTLLDVIDMLNKPKFEEHWQVAAQYIAEAYQRLTTPSGGYGAFQNDWIPYTTIIVPLAVLLHAVASRKGGEEMYRKLDRWYWSCVFSQRYDQAVDSTGYRDVKEITDWMDGKLAPAWLDAVQISTIDLTVDESRSAIYRGIMCAIALAGAKDFISGQAVNLKDCQDDHIFPKSKFSAHPRVNSIVNRTLISSSSNQIKSDKKPSEFLPLFLSKHGGDQERLSQTLHSHLISDEAVQAMTSNDLENFLTCREQTIRERLTAIIRG
ncbi:MAG: DUF262 domain-containing protein [Verrucomicrobiae bacterium]|nr:DUF262 domain-containing protein [Verrucomicrobiae bacterium]MDW8344912.1 DUF262 domain-containing protein [Verrucomicrobiae bacterium]